MVPDGAPWLWGTKVWIYWGLVCTLGLLWGSTKRASFYGPRMCNASKASHCCFGKGDNDSQAFRKKTTRQVSHFQFFGDSLFKESSTIDRYILNEVYSSILVILRNFQIVITVITSENEICPNIISFIMFVPCKLQSVSINVQFLV